MRLDTDRLDHDLRDVVAAEGCKTAADKLEDFETWCEANGPAVRAMTSKAEALAAKRGYVSVRDLFAWLRTEWPDVMPDVDGFKVRNVYSPIYARCLAGRSKALRAAIRTCKSEFDGLEMPDIFKEETCL